MAIDRSTATAHRTLLRIYAHAPCVGQPPHLSDLRVLVVTDVLVRTAALSGRQSAVGLSLPDLPPDQVKALGRNTDLLGIHQPIVQVGFRDVAAAVGGTADVHVVGRGAVFDGDLAGARIDVGPINATTGTTNPTSNGADSAPAAGAALPADPQTLRLALLSHAHEEPVDLTPEALAEAGRTLAHWRRQVADWAKEPSTPMHAETVSTARARFADDLDTASVLVLLKDLADAQGVSAGARFETFVHLDRVLGLELSREVGY